jgi:hypothetical protein
MASNSFLDSIIAFFSAAAAANLGVWLPGLLFRLVGLWLAAVGWNRHRILGFLLFLISSAVGLASSVVAAIGMAGISNYSRAGVSLFSVSTTLGYLSAIAGLFGLGNLVFRAKFAPPAKAEVYQS